MTLLKYHELPALHDVCRFQPMIDGLRDELNSALLGKPEVIELVLACLISRGHLLIEDLPGLGKTTLAKALAQTVGGCFSRIQCTPDLLPSDITGFNIFNQQTREFEFHEGPVFADVLLADEINRATPRSQSALFEAMAERQVTIDRHSRKLPPTFFVIATQNPLDRHGTYPLPDAQLDRFSIRLSIGYPDRATELEMLQMDQAPRTARPKQLFTPTELAELQEHVSQVSLAPVLREYLVDLTRATRTHLRVLCGLSPRGMLIWQQMAKAVAHLEGRDFVLPDDIILTAQPVLGIRLSGDFDHSEPIIKEILESVPVPTTPQK